MSGDNEALRRIRQSCERAMLTLYKMVETKVKIQTANNEDEIDLTNEKVYSLSKFVFSEFKTLLQSVLGAV